MKKLGALLFISILLASCTATYNRAEESPLKGNWTISDVTYSEQGIKVNSFGLADAQCFVGSSWNFIPNNHTGSFALSPSGDCPAATEAISWYIDANENFNMKFVNGARAKDITSGYIMEFQEISDTKFNLVQDVSFEGGKVQIVYKFLKQ